MNTKRRLFSSTKLWTRTKRAANIVRAYLGKGLAEYIDDLVFTDAQKRDIALPETTNKEGEE